MTVSEELVSVVVPAFNAEATIDETLVSIRGQTWRALEIIVVDDGSTDRTSEIARRHAQEDPRVQVIRQVNAGVAAARNHGIALARGDFVAPVDADDLWAADKIALQMARMREGGERMGLVYTWFTHIDEQSRRSPHVVKPAFEGRVFREMCVNNFVGNGSSTLLRRSAILEVGGYDPSLLARGAQGCEDIMLYLSIAERYEVGLVPKALTGYRVTATNMSANVLSMYRSSALVFEHFRARRPEYAAELLEHHHRTLYWLVVRALLCGNLKDAAWLARRLVDERGAAGARQLLGTGPFLAYALMPSALRGALRGVFRAVRPPRPHFLAAAGQGAG